MFINRLVKSTLLSFILMLTFFSSAIYAESLFNENDFDSYTSDNKARKVGDILTILITESAEATTSATTVTNKSSGVSGGFNWTDSDNKQGAIDFEHDFEGGGQIAREGSLLARLTVSVKDVLPNGYLLVQGEQEVKVNDEVQLITVEGKVRTQDIDKYNTILSTRISDAKISYNGEGLIQDQQKPGLFSQLLTIVGLFL
jgi:flagellar L-ring protein FlgH